MAISNGQPVDASVPNANYLDKTQDDTTIGKITLNDSGSGAQVTNLQQEINDLKDEFNTSTGHDHDGTDSKKVIATNLDSTGGTNGQRATSDGVGAVTWEDAGAPQTRDIAAGEGLSGGGDLSTDRTIALDVDGLSSTGSVDDAADWLVVYDDSASDHKKIHPDDLGIGGSTLTVVTESSSTTLAATGEEIVRVDATSGDITLTLPAVSGNNGLTYRIAKIDSTDNHVIIDGNSAETIDGLATIEIYGQFSSIQISCDGTEWNTIKEPTARTAYVSEVVTAGTDAGTFTSGSFVTRVLDTLVGGEGFAALSSNQVTIQPGVYDISWAAPGYRVENHQTRLVSTSGDSIDESGQGIRASGADNVASVSTGSAGLTIVAETVLELRHRCGTTKAVDGLGQKSDFAIDQVFASMTIRKSR